MKYQTILMDADNTILDFNMAERNALKRTFAKHNLHYDESIQKQYSDINAACWHEFECGLLNKPALLIERFVRLFQKLQINADPNPIRLTYQAELGKGYEMIPGASDLCNWLYQNCQLYIVTNGVSQTQYSRFAGCGLDRIVDGVFVSEDIGYQKPSPEYFQAVFRQIPGFQKEKTLLVGDSLTADIAGGISAGLSVCWYNPGHLCVPEDLSIDYVISDLKELYKIVS